MRLHPTIRPQRGLTFTEVLFLLVILLVIAALSLTFVAKTAARRSLVACQNNLKQVGLAFKVWANDGDDRFPYRTLFCPAYSNETASWVHFYVMSNELGSARLLTCPQDAQRLTNSLKDFTAGPTGLLSLTNRAVSYFVGLDGDETQPWVPLTGDRNLNLLSNFSTGPVMTLSLTNSFQWGREMHKRLGNVALSDGSVQGTDDGELLPIITNSSYSLGRPARLLMPLVH
jgi:hypothetical protein